MCAELRSKETVKEGYTEAAAAALTACSTALSERNPSASALRMRRKDAWFTLRPRLLLGSSGSTTFMYFGAKGRGSAAQQATLAEGEPNAVME